MKSSKRLHNITNEQFIEAYRENNYNCSLAAKALQNKYGISYSRQAVHERARNFPEEDYIINRLLDNDCEERLMKFADDENNDIRLRVRIYQHVSGKLSKIRIRKFLTSPS